MKTALIFAVLLLSGCATLKGVTATDDERRACAAESCTVWTDRELRMLVQRALEQGYRAGKKPSGQGA